MSYLNNYFGFNYSDLEAYAGHLKDPNDLKKSASGGAATAIYRIFLNKGFISYGVFFDINQKKVHFRLIKSIEDIELVRNSKYCFSHKTLDSSDGERNNAILDAGKRVLNGQKVLFIGLPCEIGALYEYLNKHGKDYESADNLITVDIICHGTIPESISKEYLEHIEKKYKNKATAFNLRYKENAVLPMMINIQFQGGTEHREEFDKSDYGYVFHRYLRNTCYNCNYKGANHVADLTLGDFWGISTSTPGYNKLGTSVLIPHSYKGKKIISLLEDDLSFVIHKADIYEILINNHNYFKSPTKLSDYNVFWKDYEGQGLSFAVERAKQRNKQHTENSFLFSLSSFKEVRERLIHIEGKIDRLENHIDSIASQLDRIEKKLKERE